MDLSSFLASRRPTKVANTNERKQSQGKKITTQKQKAHKTVSPSNLAAKKPADDNDDNSDDEDDNHKGTTTAKGKPKSTAKSKAEKLSEVDGKPEQDAKSELDAKAVPVPAPDTGLHSVKPSAIHSGILPAVPSQTPTPLSGTVHTYGSGFSALPPLTMLATSTALSRVLAPTGAPDATGALGASQARSSDGKESRHLSVVVIVLVAIGVAFLLLGGLVLFWRMRSRPRKRSCPTPSRPVLQDPFADQATRGDEESLFGGKERSSAVARPNSNGLYPWVQYAPKTSEASSRLEKKAPTTDVYLNGPPIPPPAMLTEKAPQPPAAIHAPIPISFSANPPVQQMQSALTRAAHRVSTLSMSIYPGSPRSAQTTHTGIGLAIGCPSPLTADGTPVLQRKPSKDRVSRNRRSLRHSLAATEYLDIYGGAQITSPDPTAGSLPTPSAPIKSAMRKSTSVHTNAQGRARVKAGYTPGAGAAGAALRASSTVAGIRTLDRANRTSMMGPSEADMQSILPPLSPAHKSDARRERDTRALASALGLPSPIPQDYPSPVPTLAPEDSITLAGDKMRSRRGTQGHSRAQSEVMSPGTEASARLGNLMLAEFTSMASLPSTRTVAGVTPSGSRARVVPRKHVNAGMGTGGGSRMDDKPPRVPSPPPLPSLAQMAMAHAHPDEYADYRSPTYSIYGLYETDRKSRMTGDGHGF